MVQTNVQTMTIDQIKYNKDIEVTQNQYVKIMTELAGICAGREDDGKFYVRIWFPKYKNLLLEIINE